MARWTDCPAAFCFWAWDLVQIIALAIDGLPGERSAGDARLSALPAWITHAE